MFCKYKLLPLECYFMLLLLAPVIANAQYSQAGSNPFPALASSAQMVFIDVDKDGDADLLYQNSSISGQGWNFMLNTGNGSYTTIAASNGTFTSGPFNGISFTAFTNMYAVDYDNDGDFDLLDQQASSSRLLINNGNGTFSVAGVNPFPAMSYPARMIFIDADKDGDKDVLYQNSNTSGQGWNFMLNTGNGSYTTIAASSGTFNAGPFNGISFTAFTNMYAVDYDNDGDVDLLDQRSSSSRLLVNNGNGAFSVAGVNPFPVLSYPARMIFFDADMDGDLDVLYQASTSTGAGWNYMINTGSGSYITLQANSTGLFSSGNFVGNSFTNFGNMYALDFDGDGDLDLLDQQANFSRVLSNSNTPPHLTSSTPANGAVAVNQDDNILLSFSKTIFAGTGKIYIKRSSDNALFATLVANTLADVTGTGTSTIVLHPGRNFGPNTTYYISFDVTAFKDASNAAFGTLAFDANAIRPITSPNYLSFSTNSLLPLKLISFTANKVNGGVRLNWKTVEESNIDYFQVETSVDGSHFQTLGQVNAANIETGSDYAYLDASALSAVRYYRLKIRERNLTFTYSATIRVVNGSSAGLQVYPTLVTHSIHVNFDAGAFERIELYDNAGRSIARYKLGANDSAIDISLDGVSPGQYYLQMIGAGKVETRQFIKR